MTKWDTFKIFVYYVKYIYICVSSDNKTDMTTKDNGVLNQLSEIEKELLSQLQVIRNAITDLKGEKEKVKNKVNTKLNHTLIKIPKEYNPNLIWKDKVLFALNKLKKAYVSQILDFILDLEKGLDTKATKKAITMNASKLFQDGIIGAEEEANKNKYYLK